MRRSGIPNLLQSPLLGALTALTCVDELVPAGEVFEQVLPQNTVQMTITGSADITVNDRPFTHRPGRLFAAGRGAVLHERSTRPWRLRYVMLDGPWCESLLTALHTSGGAVMLDRPPKAWCEALDTAVEAGLEGGPGSTWRIAAALATVLGGLAAAAPGAGDLLAEVGRLIDAAPERPWSVVALSRSLKLSPRTLLQRFRALTGDGPARWVLHRRMAHARLLLQRGVAVNDTAMRLGFANPFHFSRAFKRCTGIPPSACRQPPAP